MTTLHWNNTMDRVVRAYVTRYPQQHHQRHLNGTTSSTLPPFLPHSIALLLLHPTHPPLLPSSSHPTSCSTSSGTTSSTLPPCLPHSIALLLHHPPPPILPAAAPAAAPPAAPFPLASPIASPSSSSTFPTLRSSLPPPPILPVLLSSVVVSGYNLRSVVFQEGSGLQLVAPTAPTGPAPAHPGAEPSPPGDPPTFAPNVNDPQSSQTAICTYRTNLQEHLRLQLHYEDDRRIYDDAAARYNKYHEDLDTYTAELAHYTTKITAWRVADQRALAILLATIPSSLKRELSPTSSSHL
ncbi:unnamed protein product [Closterium sp. NIES-64]|nr:unnamed protein product [Closterium sp. NIES-64]